MDYSYFMEGGYEQQIPIEPRLLEYMKKRHFYKTNNIKPEYKLELEFQITDNDLDRLKEYVKAKKQRKVDYNALDELINSNIPKDLPVIQNINHNLKESGENMLSQQFAEKTQFLSDELAGDQRLAKMKQKMSRDQEAKQMRDNYQQYIFGTPNQQFNLIDLNNAPSDAFDQGNLFLDSRKYQSDYSLNVSPQSKRVYTNVPSHLHNQTFLPWSQCGDVREEVGHNPDLTNIIGNLDTYVDRTNNVYQLSNQMDQDNKMVIPQMNTSNKKNLNTSQYTPIPLMSTMGLKDVDMENKLLQNVPDKTAKAKGIGYYNPSEHYFDYIDSDIQSTDHVILPFARGGEATRTLNNFKKNKHYRTIA